MFVTASDSRSRPKGAPKSMGQEGQESDTKRTIYGRWATCKKWGTVARGEFQPDIQ